jgi:P4 family phage/plasmid primase-like protien
MDIKRIAKDIAKDNDSFVLIQNKKPIKRGPILENLVNIDEAISQDKYGVGVILRENLIRIDIDKTRKLEKYIENILPDTLVFKTKRGFHIYFETNNPNKYKKGDFKLYNQLDVEIIPAREKWFAPLPINDEDRYVFKYSGKIASIEDNLFWDKQCASKKIGEDIQYTLPIKSGHRDKELFKIACVLKDKLDDPKLLHTINDFCVQPPMSASEVDTKWGSANSYEKNYEESGDFWNVEFKMFETMKSGAIKLNLLPICRYLNRNNTYRVFMQNNIPKFIYVWKENHWSSSGETQVIKDTIKLIPPSMYTNSLQEKILKTILFELTANNEITEEQLNTQKGKIFFKDVVYNLNNKRFEAHSLINYNTYFIPHEVRDLPYVNIKESFYYNKFMRLCDLKADEAKLMLDWLFYCMIPTEQYKLFLILTGPSGTGKSLFLESLSYLVGLQNTSAVSLHQLSHRFVLSELENKLLNIDGDGSADSLKDTSVIKKITGNDRVRLERKGKDAYTFRPFSRHAFSFNTLPLQSADKSDAFFARLRVLEMDTKLAGDKEFKYFQDKSIEHSIIELIPYLIDKVAERVYVNKTITQSATSQSNITELKINSDPIHMLMEEKVKEQDNLKISLKDLYDKYLDCCDELDVQPIYKSIRMFNKEMIKQGTSISEDGKFWLGYGEKDPK